MKATLEKVAEDALRLPAPERAALARILIHSADVECAEDAADVDLAWQVEVERRLDEVLAGNVKSVPAAEVFARLRKKYG